LLLLLLLFSSGPHGAGNALLDALDASLRREAALEGVYQWAFHKLMSPLVAAEILVRAVWWSIWHGISCFSVLASAAVGHPQAVEPPGGG
jgi:hypothetical protein